MDNVKILFTSPANYHKHYKYIKGSVCTELMQFLLVIRGNVELNPGSQTPKYPCKECENAVTTNNIACDICNTWYHCECAGTILTIGDIVYDKPNNEAFIKNHTRVKKVGHTSEFLFGIY